MKKRDLHDVTAHVELFFHAVLASVIVFSTACKTMAYYDEIEFTC